MKIHVQVLSIGEINANKSNRINNKKGKIEKINIQGQSELSRPIQIYNHKSIFNVYFKDRILRNRWRRAWKLPK